MHRRTRIETKAGRLDRLHPIYGPPKPPSTITRIMREVYDDLLRRKSFPEMLINTEAAPVTYETMLKLRDRRFPMDDMLHKLEHHDPPPDTIYFLRDGQVEIDGAPIYWFDGTPYRRGG